MSSILPEGSDSKSDPSGLLVTDEYFDYLQAESERPAKPPNPAMVDLLRATRGQIKQVGGDA